MRWVKVLLITALVGVIMLTACGTKSNDAASTAEMANGQTETSNMDAEEGGEKIMSQKMNLTIGDTTVTATLADNSSAQALVEKLKEGDIKLNLHDYASFEKVGDLGFFLPRNDTQITTEAGDLILYQGNHFVLYYDTNSWSFTRLGKIDDISANELKSLLGNGDVTITLSIK